MIQPLLLHLAIILATAYSVSVFGQAIQRGAAGRLTRDMRISPIFAMAALLLMAFPAYTPFGATIDARAAPIVLAGIFGGPISAGLTVLVGGAGRAWIGGPYATGGVLSIALYGLLGLVMRPVFARANSDGRRIVLLGVVALASVVVVLPSFLIDVELEQSLRNLRFILPFLITQNVVGIMLLGVAIIRIVRITEAGSEAALLRMALERAANGVLIIKGRESQLITYANPWVEAVLEQPHEGLIGRNWIEALLPDGNSSDLKRLREGIMRSTSAGAEFRIQTPSARRLIIKATVSPVIDERADSERFILILDDVTQERGQAQLLSVVTEHLPLLIAYFDRDMRCRHVNGTYTRFFGVDADDLIGRHLRDIVGPESFAIIEPSVRTVLGGRTSERRIEINSPVTGTRRIMRESLFPQIDAGSKEVDGYVVMVEDITEQVRTEDSLRRSEKLSAIGTLTGSIAHDFNNLSAVVIGNVELAQVERDEARRAQFLRGALDASARAAALTKKLLSFARQAPLAPELLNLVDELQGQTRFLEVTLSGRVPLRMRVEDDVPPILADRNGLLNAILNLVINARDASASGQPIDISAHRLHIAQNTAQESNAWSGDLDPLPPGDYACIEVADQGSGVPPEARQRILDPFFTTKPFGQGAGLGLSITHGFVRQSGGMLRIADNQPRGTRVTLFFPAATGAASPAVTQADKPASFHAEGRRILVVEDEPDVLAVLSNHLQALGFSVEGHGSADSAATALSAGTKADFIMTDLVLPGTMQGAQFAALARDCLPDAGVIILSGFPADQLALLPRQDQRTAILQKPLTRAQIVETLAAIDRRRLELQLAKE